MTVSRKKQRPRSGKNQARPSARHADDGAAQSQPAEQGRTTMPDTGVMPELFNDQRDLAACDAEILADWCEWRALEKALRGMDDSDAQEKLSDRQCRLEDKIEHCLSPSAITIAAKIDIALSMMGYDSFLGDGPQCQLCSVLRNLADQLPDEMRAGLSLAISPDFDGHHIGELYTGKGFAYTVSRFEEACEDLASLPDNWTDAARAPYLERRALTLLWVFNQEPRTVEDAVLKLKVMSENIGELVDRGSYFADGLVRGIKQSAQTLEHVTSDRAGERSAA
jgi:hypothetical protein